MHENKKRHLWFLFRFNGCINHTDKSVSDALCAYVKSWRMVLKLFSWLSKIKPSNRQYHQCVPTFFLWITSALNILKNQRYNLSSYYNYDFHTPSTITNNVKSIQMDFFIFYFEVWSGKLISLLSASWPVVMEVSKGDKFLGIPIIIGWMEDDMTWWCQRSQKSITWFITLMLKRHGMFRFIKCQLWCSLLVHFTRLILPEFSDECVWNRAAFQYHPPTKAYLDRVLMTRAYPLFHNNDRHRPNGINGAWSKVAAPRPRSAASCAALRRHHWYRAHRQIGKWLHSNAYPLTLLKTRRFPSLPPNSATSRRYSKSRGSIRNHLQVEVPRTMHRVARLWRSQNAGIANLYQATIWRAEYDYINSRNSWGKSIPTVTWTE